MIDACIRCYNDKTFLGVLCISFLSDELLGVKSDTFKESVDMYAFLIDSKGTHSMKCLTNLCSCACLHIRPVY